MINIFFIVPGIVTQIDKNTVTLLQQCPLDTMKIYQVPDDILDNITEGEIVAFNCRTRESTNRNGYTYTKFIFVEWLENSDLDLNFL